MMKFESVIQGLTELHLRMSQEPTWQTWPEEFCVFYRFQLEAQVLLDNKFRLDSSKHSLWNDAYTNVGMYRSFEALFWIKSFEHIARLQNVPMSWIAAIKLTAPPTTGHEGQWELLPLSSFIDPDGYCYESVWASHLDGVKQGLITNTEFPFQRDPSQVAITDAKLARDLEA